MSRSYRIAVRESSRRILKAADRVSTQLELLEILPPAQMGELLAAELERRGYQRENGKLVRREDGIQVSVDPRTGTVEATAENSCEVELHQEREGRAWDDVGPSAKSVRNQLRKEARKDLDKQAEEKTRSLQSEVTDRLERRLGELRRELDQAVNQATAAALKQKAAQLGRIKEMHEDPQAGSLTIVVEV